MSDKLIIDLDQDHEYCLLIVDEDRYACALTDPGNKRELARIIAGTLADHYEFDPDDIIW